MKVDQSNILGELERLGAAFPWECVELEMTRHPAGRVSFACWLRGDAEGTMGLDYQVACGASPQECVDSLINEWAQKRNPESALERKKEELKKQLEKLESITLGLPPYRPNRELAAGYVTTPDPVVDIPATPTEPLCEGTRLAIEGERA